MKIYRFQAQLLSYALKREIIYMDFLKMQTVILMDFL